MKTKQSGVCELSPFGEMPAYTNSEKANARLGKRYAVTKKWIWISGMLLSGTVLPAAAEQPMAGMKMQEKTAQASHQGTGKVVAVDRAKSSIKLAHEAIKSLGWPSMTMDFSVANAALLEGIKAGDAVTFELGQGSKPGNWLITRITPQGAKKQEPSAR